MAPLAQAFVRIRADSSLLGVEATRDASRAGDKAGAAMGRSMSSGLTRTFKAVAGIGAATGLIELGRKVLDLADKFEAARSSAEQNTANIGVAFSSIEKPIGAVDDKMAALGFTMAETEGSFSQLVTATRNPAKAMRDVALAADIARGRHVSLSEATGYLMRVETGHVAMLGRLGIATHNANGTLFTQQQAIDALAAAYGGNAARFADTFAGKQAALRAELGNSATKIGVSLLPAFVDLAGVIQHQVLPPIVAATHWFDQHKKTIEPLIGIIGGTVIAWKAYGVAVRLAAAANLVFARSAVAAEAGAVGTGAAANAGRARLLGFGGAAAGAGLLYAGSKLHGDPGRIATDAGAGALAGSVIGPEGAAAGAIGGAVFGAMTNALNDFFPKRTSTPADENKAVISNLGAAAQGIVGAYGGTAENKALGIKGISQVDAALAGLKAANQSNIALQKEMASSLGAEGTAAMRTAAQIETASRKLLDLSGAQDALREAFHQAAQTAADNGRALSGNSDAALANRDAVRREADAIFAVIEAMKAHGASASAQATELGILERALEINATKTYGDKDAVDALLRSLGLIPDAVSAAATALAALNQTQQDLLNSDTPSKGAILQLNAGVAKAKAEAATTGKKVAESFTAGYSPVVAKGVEKAAKTAADKAAAAFKAARDKMLSDVDTIRQAIAGTQQQIAGFADFTAQGTDALGASGLNTDVAGQLKAKASRLEQFARLFNQLDRMHLDPHLMAQFAQIGPDAIPAMQALIHSGAKGIGTVNRIESRIQAAGTSVARTETKEQESGLIHHDLLKLPAKLSREFVKDLKGLHLSVSLKESDWKNGKGVLVSP